jgi:tetratricopeptide (TPR) repeat protein
VIFMNMGKLGMMERVQQLAAEASAKPSPQAYLELGELQQAAGLAPDARQSFQTALKLNPKFADAQKALQSLSAPASQ